MPATRSVLGLKSRSKGTNGTTVFASGVSVAAGATSIANTLTYTGVEVGDMVYIQFRGQLNAGLVQTQEPYVSAANTIVIPLYNYTGSPIVPSSIQADIAVL